LKIYKLKLDNMFSGAFSIRVAPGVPGVPLYTRPLTGIGVPELF
jgi:hypothetical protein